MNRKPLSNVIIRVLLFLLALPAIAAAILLVQDPYFPLFSLLIAIVTILAGLESATLFGATSAQYPGSRVTVPLVALTLPLTAYLLVSGILAEQYIGLPAIAAVSVVLSAQVFRRDSESFSGIIPSIQMHTMVLIYPGFFVSYVVFMFAFEGAAVLMLVFLAAVFLNDSLAYVFGRLFGRGKGGVVPISPNKSIPGFLGGLITSPAVLAVAQILYPALFPGSIWRSIVLGVAIGIATVFGDLIESGMKRSATVKDSGTIIPGRGGILDSIDSPVFAAPVYFYLYAALFLL